MASTNIITMQQIWQPPEQFNFANNNEWPRWLNRFKRYREASGLSDKPESQQIASLVYCMGPQAEDVFLTLTLTGEEAKTYSGVVQAFDNHFVPKRNVIYERSIFNQRCQREGESADEYITALHSLAEHCDYKELKSELIRDRIVVGIKDRTLTERLQLRTDLTLDTATMIVRQSEQVKRELTKLPSNDNSKVEIERVMSRQNKKKEFFRLKCNSESRKTGEKFSTKKSYRSEKRCGRCDGEPHRQSMCPATKVTCHRCQKKGHYAKVCRNSTENIVHRVCEAPDAFIGSNQTEQTSLISGKGRWSVALEIANCRIDFKADTGADVTCISDTVYQTFFDDQQIRAPERRIYNANKRLMNTLGYFRETVTYRGKSKLVDIYIIEGLERSLLDGDTCEELGILRRADVGLTKANVKEEISFDPIKVYPKLFEGLGCFKVPYRIRLKPDAVPYSLTVPRRIPIPMLNEIKSNLDKMVLLDVIELVEEPTDWCSGLVLAPKPNGTIRMCVDYVHLNKFVQREIHPMPNTENILGRLGKAKFFSKMDANYGFWQCELDKESQLLTAFITPFGRYKYKRLPFGINAAPEFFQKRMQLILQGLDGVQVNIDDILVYSTTMKEHEQRLHKVFQALVKAGVTLNNNKCIFGATKIKFLGHIIDENGIHIDEEQVKAIKEMEQPETISELRSLLGSVNYLGRFIPSLSTKAHALNELLSEKNEFVWGPDQEKAFKRIKADLIKAPVLAWFDPNKETVITADASSYGVGAVLKQKQENGKYRPIAYASKTLTTHQKSWAQIEKEGYALVWACERFRDFIIGIQVVLETDHKPLVSLFGVKELDELTPKLQRMRLRLARYFYEVHHIPGKELGVADILSRRPMSCTEDDNLETHITAYVQMITDNLPATDGRLQEIYQAQLENEICNKLREFSLDGWPRYSELTSELKDYWQHRSELTVQDDLLMKGSRIFIPSGPLRKNILQKLHEGHLGITKCRARAKDSVWWPKITVEIEDLIKNCSKCIQEMKNNKEPLIPCEFPERPWQKVGMDLFKLEQKWYLIITDYYSRYPELALLHGMTEAEIIKHAKSIFARHGTPEEVFSDNGTHFGPVLTSNFTQFAKDWGFKHTTSSPRYPQSNGFIEAIVKIVKRSLKKSDDGYKALQSYRATPLANGFSPAELLLGRRIRTTVPLSSKQLEPNPPNKELIQSREKKNKLKQKLNYDMRHRVRNLPDLKPKDRVWIIDLRRYGYVKAKHDAPRSYLIETDRRVVRRNRFHLVRADQKESENILVDLPEEELIVQPRQQGVVPMTDPQQEENKELIVNRFGRQIIPPKRLITEM